jgi:hypothetical protein
MIKRRIREMVKSVSPIPSRITSFLQFQLVFQAVAVPFHIDHHGVVEKPVEDRGHDDRVLEELGPFG